MTRHAYVFLFCSKCYRTPTYSPWLVSSSWNGIFYPRDDSVGGQQEKYRKNSCGSCFPLTSITVGLWFFKLFSTKNMHIAQASNNLRQRFVLSNILLSIQNMPCGHGQISHSWILTWINKLFKTLLRTHICI